MIPRSGEVRARRNIGVAGQRYFVDPKDNTHLSHVRLRESAITQHVRCVHLTSALVVLATVTRTQLIVHYEKGKMKPIWN